MAGEGAPDIEIIVEDAGEDEIDIGDRESISFLYVSTGDAIAHPDFIEPSIVSTNGKPVITPSVANVDHTPTNDLHVSAIDISGSPGGVGAVSEGARQSVSELDQGLVERKPNEGKVAVDAGGLVFDGLSPPTSVAAAPASAVHLRKVRHLYEGFAHLKRPKDDKLHPLVNWINLAASREEEEILEIIEDLLFTRIGKDVGLQKKLRDCLYLESAKGADPLLALVSELSSNFIAEVLSTPTVIPLGYQFLVSEYLNYEWDARSKIEQLTRRVCLKILGDHLSLGQKKK